MSNKFNLIFTYKNNEKFIVTDRNIDSENKAILKKNHLNSMSYESLRSIKEFSQFKNGKFLVVSDKILTNLEKAKIKDKNNIKIN